MANVRVRFAPSPTGHLHVGGARTALFNWLFARHYGGAFILRIEDTDLERSTPEATEGILDSLRWLGLHWDEGPDVGGPYGPYFQGQRLHLYREFADRLVKAGRAYPCFCTPEELQAKREARLKEGLAPRYDRTCLSLPKEEVQARIDAGEPYVLRFLADQEGEMVVDDLIRGQVRFERQVVDDYVIMKSDGYPTYNFACVVDDHLMAITHVIRGEEHLPNTPRQIQVYEALGVTPPRFAHLPIILGTDRSKLSKRHGATWVGEFRAEGYLPEALVNYMALLGWAYDDRQELFTIDELIEKFTVEKISKSPAIFDRQKLDWMNGVYIRRCDLDRLTDEAAARLVEADILPEPPQGEQREKLKQIVALLQTRIHTLADFVPMAGYFFTDEVAYDEKAARKFLTRDYVPELFQELLERLGAVPADAFDEPHLEPIFKDIQERTGMKLGDIIQPVRVALTGNSFSPGIYDVLSLLGKEKVLHRLETALAARSGEEAPGREIG